ncbi:MAG: hypothetical protein LH660_09325 [Phormidesmis sp. CAN_BIN36]|nr:hypothetical protein [Phormidesmis sp. CAN_BIN36]
MATAAFFLRRLLAHMTVRSRICSEDAASKFIREKPGLICMGAECSSFSHYPVPPSPEDSGRAGSLVSLEQGGKSTRANLFAYNIFADLLNLASE